MRDEVLVCRNDVFSGSHRRRNIFKRGRQAAHDLDDRIDLFII